MENLKISKSGGPGSGFQIEGFPEAVKVVVLKDAIAKRISHLVLHLGDLDFAERCLQTLAIGQVEPTRSALWTSAITHFYKCFGNSKARFRLDPRMVYRGEDELALENFFHFQAMRNKHFVHDENAFLQAHTGAVINGPSSTHKIAKIITFSARGDILGQDSFTNLRLLIEGAKKWVVAEHDKLCDDLTVDLERRAHADLLGLPPLQYSKPDVEDASNTRP